MGNLLMTTKQECDLDGLAQRVEAAIGKQQRELLYEAWDALGPIARWKPEQASRFASLMDLEGYVSAALMFVPAGAFWRVGHDGEGPDPSMFAGTIGIEQEGDVWITFRKATADTAPLAILAASLRARSAVQS